MPLAEVNVRYVRPVPPEPSTGTGSCQEVCGFGPSLAPHFHGYLGQAEHYMVSWIVLECVRCGWA